MWSFAKKSFDTKGLVRTLVRTVPSTLVRTKFVQPLCAPLCAPCGVHKLYPCAHLVRTLVRTMVGTDLVRTMLVAHVQVMVLQAVATAQGVHSARFLTNNHIYIYIYIVVKHCFGCLQTG